ncbi:MAG: tetratricopeptide repeat protein, partial [Gammaproteobacteria bacterium]|nr:tetratricopeptide repeat protein [Gammaproteobacteria bacterium]
MSGLFYYCNNSKRRCVSLSAALRVLLFSLCFFFLFFVSSHAFAETPTLKKLIDESVGLLMDKDADGALQKLDQVLLLSPKHPEAVFRKGQALLLKRDAKNGLEFIIESTRLEPENVRFSLYLALIYSKQGKIDKAMQEYQRIIDTGTTDLRVKEAEMLLSLATARSLAMKNEVNAALLIFNGLLLEYPDNPQVLYNIGNAYMKLNRIEEGERIFVKLHELGPKNPTVNMSLAKIYEGTNRLELAKKHLKLIMDLNMNDELSKNATVQYYIIQGRQELDNSQWEAALRSLQKVVTIDPSRTEAFFNISMANLRLGNTLMAERGFLSVLKVTPDDFSARLNLGQMYFDIGRTEDAITQFQYIIDKDISQRFA